MEFFKGGKVIDFMRYRRVCGTASGVLVLASIVGLFFPGPNYGIDFRGGTELEIELKSKVSTEEMRNAVESLGYHRPDVISVAGANSRYILRIQEVSSLPAKQA